MKTKANTGIKMLNDLCNEEMTKEQIKSLNEYCEKLNKGQKNKPFMIVSAELAKILNNIVN